jgi:hypothetical protein
MKRFDVDVRSAFPEWDRYDLFLTAVCFGPSGEMIDYLSRTGKEGVLQTPPCSGADLYLYVIAREFPASGSIAASPPFPIEISVSTDGAAPTVKTYDVNQWGGLSIKQSLA